MTEPTPHRNTTVPPATIRHHIDGGPVASGTNRTFENVSPVDGSLVSLVAEAGADEVDAAVAAAGRALRGPWAGLSTADRGKLLHAVADEIDRRFEEFVAAEVADTGMPESFARSVVIPRGAANFRFFADLVKNLPAENFHLDTPDGAGALNYVVRGPKGVIAVICPWNLPLLLTTWKLGTALACGSWIEPTIWTGLDEDSPVVREEIFGPCCHIRPFDDPDEAVALANDTGYGLACTLWTENASRAHRLGRRIDAGIVWINSWFLRDLRTPFGGTKRSGIGREGGASSLEFYTETRNVCIKL